MSSPFVPIETADLNWCNDLPVSKQFNDIYNSAESGIMQSRYVFIDGNNLINQWQALPEGTPSLFNIGETGFGTGLNFLLTWKLWEQYAPNSANLHYISCEKHPLNLSDLKKCLNIWLELATYTEQLIEAYPVLTPGYHHLEFCHGRVKLTLMLGDAQECFEQLLVCGESQLEPELRTNCIHAWYLDGFSPSKNKSMWTDSLFTIIAMLSKPYTSFATYTVAGSVKASLQKAGFNIEKKKGFGPKKHMLIGTYQKNIPIKLRNRQTPWHIGYPFKSNNKTVHIVGGGLAGCYTANCLAKRGWKVTLFEEMSQVGGGASANQQAVLFPKLSAYKSPLTQLMLSGFLYASQIYKQLINQNSEIGSLCGSLLLAFNQKETKAQQSIKNWLQHYPELGQLVDEIQSSKLSGLELTNSGLFIPMSGWINSPELCRFLLSREEITLIQNTQVKSLLRTDSGWIIHDRRADAVILCNGNKVNHYCETSYLPVKSIRGQMSSVSSTTDSSKLKIPVCAEGHVLPTFNGSHSFGASYHQNDSSMQTTIDDDESNLSKLFKITSANTWSNEVTHQWAGVRASAPDYLPLVGPVVHAKEFMQVFSGLETNSKRWIAKPGPYIPGLYVCAGFGSRGLTTIPLCAEWLASLINNEIGCLPRNLIHAFSPARFLRKAIIQGV